jgi:LysM repeat protein
LLGLGSSLLAQPAINYPKKNIDGKEYYEYPVQKSEGFFSITRKFDVSKEEILKANPGASNGPTFGSVLLIPVKDRNYKIHKVASKETLFSIKQKYNTSYEELYAAAEHISIISTRPITTTSSTYSQKSRNASAESTS